MGAGLLFFFFAYYIHLAHSQKDLFASGIENNEDNMKGIKYEINTETTLDEIPQLLPKLSEDFVKTRRPTANLTTEPV